MSHGEDRKPDTPGGNGGVQERRHGIDRRIDDTPAHEGPDRRQTERRKSERRPDKPIKR